MLARRLSRLPLPILLSGGVGLLAWLPAAHASVHADHRTAQAFFYGGLGLMVLTAMLAIATRGLRMRNPESAALAALAGAYLAVPLAMAFPVVQAVPDTSFGNAWFEMLSSFTTTGASVYEAGRLPPSVHLWRGLAGWLGGWFILVAATSILAPLNLGGAEVLSGRVPGQRLGASDAEARRLEEAWRILLIYSGLTFLLWVLLLMAGEDGLLALTHAMGTLSTSGISAGVGLAVTGSGIAGEMLIFLFLLLALSRRLMRLPGHDRIPGPLWRDPELRLAALLVVLVVAVLMLRHLYQDALSRDMETPTGILRAFWGAIFTAVSFLTTTGYESLWWTSARSWSGLGSPGLLLLGLAIIGGGIATTAGGVTLLRVWALWLQGRQELERIVHPDVVAGGGPWQRHLAREGAWMAWVFFMFYALSIALVLAALTLAGETFQRALVLGIAALTTTGPLAAVAGNCPGEAGGLVTAVTAFEHCAIDWATLTGPVKAILGVTMILGRLETLALVALLIPGGWRR